MPSKEELYAEANKDPSASPYRVSVLYADYGKRKTSTACAMVGERGLLLSSDDSWKVLLNDSHKELLSKVHITKLDGLKQLEYVNFDGDEKGEYDTIIWDTVSRSADNFLAVLYHHAGWGGKFREKLITQHKELKGLENLAPVDYMVCRDTFRPILDRLFQLNKHIIFTSQFIEPVPGLSKDLQTRPSIPSATFKLIGERADIIANIKPQGSRKFVADMAENSLTVLGKSRIQELQGVMDLDAFVAKYKEIVFK